MIFYVKVKSIKEKNMVIFSLFVAKNKSNLYFRQKYFHLIANKKILIQLLT